MTSTVQEEGKSYIAANLATAFSQLGQRVLVIDGDLRRPKVHKNFALSSEFGVSDFLAGRRPLEELDEVIQSTPVPNLKVLACGTRPPNPSELLNTPKLGALVAWANERFDRIIVDCTPMFPIHDTLLWGRHIRPVVFVVRYGKTRVPLINRACQSLQGGGLRVLGVAVNDAKMRELAYAPYGYHYHQYYQTYSAESIKKVPERV